MATLLHFPLPVIDAQAEQIIADAEQACQALATNLPTGNDLIDERITTALEYEYERTQDAVAMLLARVLPGIETSRLARVLA